MQAILCNLLHGIVQWSIASCSDLQSSATWPDSIARYRPGFGFLATFGDNSQMYSRPPDGSVRGADHPADSPKLAKSPNNVLTRIGG